MNRILEISPLRNHRAIGATFLLLAAALLAFFATPALAQEMRVQHQSTELYSGDRFDFGPTAVGRPVSRELVIRNLGDRDLLIGSIEVPAGFTVLRQPSTQIPPRGSSNLIVEFSARSFGRFSGVLSFPHNARNAGTPFEITVLGNSGPVGYTGAGQQADQDRPQIRVQNGERAIPHRGSFSFGVSDLGRPAGREFRIFNDGSSELRLGELTLPEGFRLVSPPPEVIPAGRWGAFSVELAADLPGIHSGTIELAHDGANAGSPFEISIAGTVRAVGSPRIRVQHGDTAIASGSSFDFGVAGLGQPVGRELRIFNDGDGELRLDAVSLPDGFTLVAAPPEVIAPGAWGAFAVRLTAQSAGDFSGRLSFRHGATNARSPFEMLLSGTVTAGGQPMIRVQNGDNVMTSGGVFDFGVTVAGKPIGRQFQVFNDGGSPLELGFLEAPAGFRVIVKPAPTIPAGGSGAFSLQLDADKAGQHSGDLIIRHNAANAPRPLKFTVQGTVR